MVSAGVSFEGKGSLHFVDEKSKGQCRLLSKAVAAKITGRLSPVVWPTVYFPTRSKTDSAVACRLLSRPYWQRLHGQWPPNSPDINPLDYHVWGSMLEKFSHLNPRPKDIPEPKSCSADENLERFITRRNPQVNCQFQKTSASLCKRRWRIIWAFTVTLLIDFRLRALVVFATLKANIYSKTWSLSNCALILQVCSIRFLLFLVSLGSVKTQLRWSGVFYNSFAEYSCMFPLMQKV